MFLNGADQKLSMYPDWAHEDQMDWLVSGCCYYRTLLGLLGLICPEQRSDWRSRGDAEDAARSLSNRLRCWSTKWRIVCISAFLIGSDTSYSYCLMYVMMVHRRWWRVQLNQALNWDLQLIMPPVLNIVTSFLPGPVRWRIQTDQLQFPLLNSLHAVK